jgi:hypothetical protein
MSQNVQNSSRKNQDIRMFAKTMSEQKTINKRRETYE